MREKELRLALVCYGGISLAVYMHGITKEIWHLARASRAFAAGDDCETESESAYRRLLECMSEEAEVRLRGELAVRVRAAVVHGLQQRELLCVVCAVGLWHVRGRMEPVDQHAPVAALRPFWGRL